MSTPTPEGLDGEEALIARYFAPLAQGVPGAHGLKDDCATLTPPPGFDLVLTTDAIAEGVHFFANDAARDIAWKALAVNVSDLASKGAKPSAYLLAIAFPQVPSASWLESLVSGLSKAQAHFGISLAGGDTDMRPGPLAITITALGFVPHARAVRRTSAKAGDALYVTGNLGQAALGLMLRRDPTQTWTLSGPEQGELLAKYLRPTPPHHLADAILAHARAAMDLSDGLAKDVDRMARASEVGVTIHCAHLPLSNAVRKALSNAPELIERVLAGGDDYEFALAIPPQHEAAFLAAAWQADCSVTRIGIFTAAPGLKILDADSEPLALRRLGWDHFATR